MGKRFSRLIDDHVRALDITELMDQKRSYLQPVSY